MTARDTRASHLFISASVLLLVLVFSISCGGGGPTAPDLADDNVGATLITPNERNARAPEGLGNHNTWGVYTMVIDQVAKTIEVVDNRELALHLNVRNMLESDWWCPAHNCIKIQFLNIDDINHIYTIKGTLVNPTWFNGFDVRVIIFYDEKDHDLLNPDDYTMLYEDEDDINPFRSYAKTVDQRQFSAFASFSEIFELYVPPAPHKFNIDFAVDASWPGNCEEPYDLENFGYDGSIYPDDPDLDGIDQGKGTVYTEVHDWQLNVSEVSVDTTPINGEITYLEYNPDLNRWEAVITNSEDTEPGEYRCLIAAFSEDDPTLGLYNYLVITVDETPPPAVQTIFGHVGDAFLLDGLDGSIVSVVNQDMFGISPEPVSVVNGEYLVNVTTGAFNITVVPNDIDLVHHSCVCWDVLVTTNEDVHLDFGLQDQTFMDPYGQYLDPINWHEIMGFAGRVVDGAGLPIKGATVELTSPDSWGLVIENQDFVQAEITDENGYYSMLNVPVVMSSWIGDYEITQYHMFIRAPGFIEADIGLLPAKIDQMQYRVVTLLPQPVQMPVWNDSFEEESGWTFSGYYHRQLYDEMIKNISFDPVYSFLVIPADEEIDGSIPEPTDGLYYLWYGVEEDGNFLGTWDPFQGQYTGGISNNPHSGTATSPEIDLTGYTEARVEFDMCYDIESQIPSNFEEMRFWINDGTLENLIRFYNPFPDPDPHHFTVSMRGYNRTVIWCRYSYDISSYTGNNIQLKFTFSTDDSLFNGCRGQFIDNMAVYAQ